MRLAFAIVLATALIGPLPARADSGRPVGKRTYWSPGGYFQLTVDARWSYELRAYDPLLTLANAAGEVVWSRGPEGFEDFKLPLHASLSDDGRFLVFGGTSVHNISWDRDYREGLRFYDEDGRLTRFVSRRDLPAGEYSVSTAHWYDAERTRIEGDKLLFFTPGRETPLEIEVGTGRLLVGELVPGQGDDVHWREHFLQRLLERDRE